MADLIAQELQTGANGATAQKAPSWQEALDDAGNTRFVPVKGPSDADTMLTAATEKTLSCGPVVSEAGTVYVGTEVGTVFSYSSDATKLKEIQLPNKSAVRCLAVEPGSVFAADKDDHLFSLNSEGDVNWDADIDTAIGHPNVLSFPITLQLAAQRSLLLLTTADGWLVVVDKAGVVKFKSKISRQGQGRPAVLGARLILYANVDGEILGISIPDYQTATKALSDSDLDSIAVNPGKRQLLISSADALECYDYSLNQLRQQPSNWRYGTPCIGSGGYLLACDAKGGLIGLDAAENVLWNAEFRHMIWQQPWLDSESTAYVVARDGTSAAYDKHGSKLWETTVADKVVGASLTPNGDLVVASAGGSLTFILSKGRTG